MSILSGSFKGSPSVYDSEVLTVQNQLFMQIGSSTQVQLMKQANNKKAQLKKIIANIDVEKTSQIKQDVFFQLLPLHQITIDDSTKQRLLQDYGTDKRINYKDALASLSIDLTKQEPLLHNWIIRRAGTAKSNLLSDTLSNKLSQHSKLINGDRTQRALRSFSINDRNNSSKRQGKREMHQTIQEVDEMDQPYQEIVAIKSHSVKLSPIRNNIRSQGSNDDALNLLSQTRRDFQHPSKMKRNDLRDQQQSSRYDDIQNKTQLIITFPNEIKKMSETEPEKFNRINYLMRQLQLAGIDIRCVEHLRLRLNGLSEVLLKDFKNLISESLKLHSTQLHLMEEVLQTFIVWSGLTYSSDNQLIKREILNDFLNLCHYWPLAVKKFSNESSNMYRILNASKAQDHETSLDFHKQQQDFKQSPIYRLLQLLNSKIHEKFDKLVQAYLFFSGNKMDKITLNEFRISLENLRIKLSTNEVTQIFEFLDKDGDGQLDYKEFCNLAEEKWKGIDPFDSHNHQHTQQHFMKQRSSSINQLSPEEAYRLKLVQPPKLEEPNEPQSFEKDAMIDSYNIYRGFKSRTIKREKMMVNSFGIKSLKSDDIRDVIANAYQDIPLDEKYRTQSYNKSSYESSKNSQRNKIFKQFHTKSSELREDKAKQQVNSLNRLLHDQLNTSQDSYSKPTNLSPQKLDAPTKKTNSFRIQSVDLPDGSKLKDNFANSIKKPIPRANLNDLMVQLQGSEHLPKVNKVNMSKDIYATPEYMMSYTNKNNNRLNQSVVVQESSPVQKSNGGHPSTAQSRAENSAILKDYYNAKKQLKPTL